MILMRILPGVLKELSKHVPTVLFQVVEWSELASELPKLSRRLLQKEDYASLLEKQKIFLGPFHVFLRAEELIHPIVKPDRWSAQKILEIFFAQLYSPHGIFLDLRPNHFEAAPPDLNWNPNGLSTTFSESFRTGLLEVYDGFYLEDDELFKKGLKKTGLISDDWPEEDKIKLGELFKAQFGSSLTGEMKFDLEEFKEAILKTCNFLLIKKVSITKDFLYLGVYLVTLYSTLELSQESFDVKKTYSEVKKIHLAAHPASA